MEYGSRALLSRRRSVSAICSALDAHDLRRRSVGVGPVEHASAFPVETRTPCFVLAVTFSETAFVCARSETPPVRLPRRYLPRCSIRFCRSYSFFRPMLNMEVPLRSGSVCTGRHLVRGWSGSRQAASCAGSRIFASSVPRTSDERTGNRRSIVYNTHYVHLPVRAPCRYGGLRGIRARRRSRSCTPLATANRFARRRRVTCPRRS